MLSGTWCSLYSARVSLHWPGIAGATPSSIQCFSSYADPRDVAHTATLTSATPTATYLEKSFAVIGYYCFKMNNFQSTSTTTTRPWWAANLGTPRRIWKVMVGAGKLVPVRFSDVEIRVGNTSGAGDFSANPLFATYPGQALARELMIFDNGPVVGSFVSIQTSGSVLGVNSVQIIAD